MAMIGAAMIVRDEEAVLEDCLRVLSCAVDEIVVVDTGSVDGTVAIAERYTDIVLRFDWCDDFAAAKNFAVDHATGEYVLVVDADEVLTEPETAKERFLAFAESAEGAAAGLVAVVSRTSQGGVEQYVRDLQPRLFRRGAFRYEGRVHEQLVAVGDAPTYTDLDLSLLHSGYDVSSTAAQAKFERNERILLAALEDTPHDEYLLQQLGKAHFSVGNYAKAADALERALERIDFADPAVAKGAHGPVSLYALVDVPVTLAYAYANLDRLADAERLLERHEALGHPGTQTADFAHAQGYVALMKGDVAASQRAYQRALVFGVETEQVLGTGSHAAHYHLALLAESEQDVPVALGHLIDALRLKPDYAPAITRCIAYIVEYRAALPGLVWEVCDKNAFSKAYAQRMLEALGQGNQEEAQLLLQAAGALSTELLRACRAELVRVAEAGE